MTGTLTTAEAAAALKVHPKTVEDLIHSGRLPAAKIGRSWVLLEAHVMQYLERQIAEQTAKRRGLPDVPTTRAAGRGRIPARTGTA